MVHSSIQSREHLYRKPLIPAFQGRGTIFLPELLSWNKTVLGYIFFQSLLNSVGWNTDSLTKFTVNGFEIFPQNSMLTISFTTLSLSLVFFLLLGIILVYVLLNYIIIITNMIVMITFIYIYKKCPFDLQSVITKRKFNVQ